MGIWGPELYDNDSACDVQDGYLDFLQDGLGNEEAYEKMLEHFGEYLGDQDEPIFWLALAETQWKVGRLRADVKEKAMEWIQNEGYLEMWDGDPKDRTGWQRTLQKLKVKLERPMPKEKRVPQVDRNPWNLHDVYAYKFHLEDSKESGFFGKYVLMQKIGEARYFERKKLFMQIQIIDHIFDELPELEDINRYRIMPQDDLRYIDRREFRMNRMISIDKPSEYPAKNLVFLGAIPGPANKKFTMALSECKLWCGIERNIIQHYHFWQGREYEVVEEGVYRETPEDRAWGIQRDRERTERHLQFYKDQE